MVRQCIYLASPAFILPWPCLAKGQVENKKNRYCVVQIMTCVLVFFIDNRLQVTAVDINLHLSIFWAPVYNVYNRVLSPNNKY